MSHGDAGEPANALNTLYNRGDTRPTDVHLAFFDRIKAWIPEPGRDVPGDHSRDTASHGTHVAGCVLADYWMNTGNGGRIRVEGIAAQAKLVVQALVEGPSYVEIHADKTNAWCRASLWLRRRGFRPHRGYKSLVSLRRLL